MVMTLAGLGLAALIVITAAQSRVLENPDTNPSRMLWARLEAAKTPADRAELAAGAHKVLETEPMNARALSLIGALEAQGGNQAKADAAMQAAFRLNRRDIAVNAWLFERELRASRYETAFTHADIMLRRNRGVGQAVFPAMAASIANPAAIKPLAARLLANPHWRQSFFEVILRDDRTLQVGPVLMAEISAAGGEITTYELSLLSQRLINAKLYDQAYLNWLLYNPLDDITQLRSVYDGGFDGWPQVPPYTWYFGPGISGAIDPADIVGREGGALHITYDGVSTPTFPSQMMMLTPGAYRFSGEVLTTNNETGGLLTWTITCVDGGPQLAALPVRNTQRTWSTLAVDFAVGPDCKAQTLRLTARQRDGRVSAEAWFDNFAVEPAGIAP